MHESGNDFSELMGKKKGKRWSGERGFGIFCFVEDMDCNVMSQILTRLEGSEKGERENDKERILKSMVVQSGENVPFFIRFLF